MTKSTPDGQILRKIIAEIPTPFHLYDERVIREHARALNKAFAWNPGFREYFAVKATPNPYILKILQQEGCGVDCASMTELMLAEACGFKGEQIMFSSNMTPGEEFAYARKLGAIINLDDYTHIDSLRENGGLPELVCLRFNPGGQFWVNDSVMGTPVTSKFGMTERQIFDAIESLLTQNVKRFALHSFLASNVLDMNYYPAIAHTLMELALRIRQRFSIAVEMINLSGGVGIPYHPEEQAPDIQAIGDKVHETYHELIEQNGMPHMRISTELGRYMTGPAGYLVTTAIHEKDIYKHYIGLDASAVDLMRPAMYGSYHHITVVDKEDAPCDTLYDVVGALCENNDKFAVDRMLPHIDMGDIVLIHDTGAHGHSMGYNYNGKLRSPEVLLKEDGNFQMIRRRQTPEDYFDTLDFSGLLDGKMKD
ncbi:diaminopimelate decarboxylase [Eubacteriales bacterium OttesenSCG-928-N13]|nr:diaminopimelate decarboxylase [Eubacteriales bacterium OttesenSCG-928-N13]